MCASSCITNGDSYWLVIGRGTIVPSVTSSHSSLNNCDEQRAKRVNSSTTATIAVANQAFEMDHAALVSPTPFIIVMCK